MTITMDNVPPDVKSTYESLIEHVAATNRRKPTMIIQLACLYAAYRINHKPRTLEEITIDDYSPIAVGRAYRKLKFGLPLPKPEEFVDRYCKELELGDNVSEHAKTVLERARHCKDFCCVCNSNPNHVAAAALYISSILCGSRRTQLEFENMCGITATCIRKHYTDICKKTDIPLSSEGGWVYNK